jgi:hypothetical protein
MYFKKIKMLYIIKKKQQIPKKRHSVMPTRRNPTKKKSTSPKRKYPKSPVTPRRRKLMRQRKSTLKQIALVAGAELEPEDTKRDIADKLVETPGSEKWLDQPSGKLALGLGSFVGGAAASQLGTYAYKKYTEKN